MAKKCMQCGGSMSKYKKGGSTTNKLNNPKGFAKAQMGGDNSKMGLYGTSQGGPTGNNLSGTYSYKKGGSIKIKKKYQEGGSAMITNTTPGEKFNPPMKKGGSVKKAKLAALAAPKNKITRADIIVGAKKKAAKKK